MGDAELSMLDQPQPGVVELLILWGETGESRDPARLPPVGLAARGWQAAGRGSPRVPPALTRDQGMRKDVIHGNTFPMDLQS